MRCNGMYKMPRANSTNNAMMQMDEDKQRRLLDLMGFK
jgi:hypothetical protein